MCMLTNRAIDCSWDRGFGDFSLTGSTRADLRDKSGVRIGKGPDAGMCALARIYSDVYTCEQTFPNH